MWRSQIAMRKRLQFTWTGPLKTNACVGKSRRLLSQTGKSSHFKPYEFSVQQAILCKVKVSTSMTDELPWQQQGHFKIRKPSKFHLLSSVWSLFLSLLSNSLPWLLLRRNSGHLSSRRGVTFRRAKQLYEWSHGFWSHWDFSCWFSLSLLLMCGDPHTRGRNCFSKTKWETLET